MANRKIQVQQPVVFPSCCINCGAVDNSGRWFVDLGFDIDSRFDAFPEGVVYLCEVCVRSFIQELMVIVEQREMGLDYVLIGGNRTDPIFDEHREQLNRIEQRTVSDSSDSESESESVLTATFGG